MLITLIFGHWAALFFNCSLTTSYSNPNPYKVSPRMKIIYIRSLRSLAQWVNSIVLGVLTVINISTRKANSCMDIQNSRSNCISFCIKIMNILCKMLLKSNSFYCLCFKYRMKRERVLASVSNMSGFGNDINIVYYIY